MSPEARASATVIVRLIQELRRDRSALARHERDVEDLLAGWDTDRRSLALAAVALHGWYTGLESLLERIVRALDGEVPTGPAWHRELLLQSAADLPSVRPALLPEALIDDLIALMKFRHFFRHAYAIDLDARRLHEELQRLAGVHHRVRNALLAFEAFLQSALEELAKTP